LKPLNHAVKGVTEIGDKITELRQLATRHAPATIEEMKETERARHQIYALQWAIGEHGDESLDWVKTALAKLGPEARELFPWLSGSR
jgi:hypothetical protein